MHEHRRRLFATSAFAGAALTLVAGGHAAAQGALPEATKAAAGQQVEEVVVTGSRIRRTEFNSPSPLTVITAEQASAEGVINTSEILQGSTIAVSARQIDNEFTGLVTAGGPGVNTLSLRGLGPQRTLILLNGKRVSPAGTRGQVGAVDLNTIPGTIVDRIDILKDGASSIYGSDAVAGVVNIITKEKQDGFTVDLSGNLAQHSGGGQYRVGASYGKTFERGYFNASIDRFKQYSLTVGQRKDLACAQDYFFDANGNRADVTYPTGDPICIGLASGVYTRNGDTARYVRDAAAVQTGSTDPNLALDLNGYRRVNLSYTNLVPANAAQRAGYNTALFAAACPTTVGNADLTSAACVNARIAYVRASQAAYPQNDLINLQQTAISPSKRTSIYLSGGHDLTDNIQAYTDILLTRRESSQVNYGQIFNNVTTTNPTNPFPFTARSTLLIPRNQDQEVDYGRAVGGLKGRFEVMNRKFDWDLWGAYSKSDASYGGDFTYADRVNAIVNLTGTPTNITCPANLITVSDGGADPNVRDGPQACVPVNVFRSGLVVPNGGVNFTPEEAAFLFGYEYGKTVYTQKMVEGSVAGDIFDLPAGPVGVAAGFTFRRDYINDTPGFNARNANYAGSTTAGITTGADTVKELFAEASVPVLKDMILAKRFDITGSYRFSDYKSYGKTNTHKIGFDWQVTDWFRIRAVEGTSFRAPALYELFLANQTGFQSQLVVDPCLNTSSSNNATLQANCDTALRAVGVAESRLRTFTAPGGSATVLTGGGGPGILEPETSNAKVVGLIFTPKFIDLRVALDYTELKVKNQVAQFGAAAIVLNCYRAANFPNDPLCQLFTRQTNPTQSNYQGIALINNSYVNISQQEYRSLDLTTQYNHDFGWAKMRFDLATAWSLKRTTQTLGQPLRDFNGEVLTPDFVANGSFRFDRGPWRATWAFDLVGKASDTEVAIDETVSTARGPNQTTPGIDPALLQRISYINNVPFTQYHHVSVRYRLEDDTLITVGVRNLFNQGPRVFSNSGNETRIGSAVLSSQYDLIGRRLFVQANRRF